MKKMLVLALAMVAFTAQAHAADREGRDAGKDSRKVEETRERAGKGGHVDSVANSIQKLEKSGLDTLSANEKHDLSQKLSRPENAEIKSALDEILANNKPALQELNKERVKGLVHVAKIDPKLRRKDSNSAVPEEKAKEAFAALVLNAGSQAEKSPAMAKEVASTLKIANEGLERGKSFDTSMDDALKALKAATKSKDSVAELMEKLKNLCNSRG